MYQTDNYIKDEVSKLQGKINESKKLLDSATASGDPEMLELAREEINVLTRHLLSLERSSSSTSSIHNEAEDDSSQTDKAQISPDVAILEIRAGTGGSEAALFAQDLLRMYTRYSENVGWKLNLLDISEEEKGGIKTAIAEVSGKNSYETLKFESGTHRVQRVPITESSGRIHTSAATVAVLPKVSEVQVDIKPEDISTDFYRSGGSGGQNVNKVSTAVRLTHVPTGVVVECQQERTQGKNREKAMDILRSRIYTLMQEQQTDDISKLRANQVGSGDRSEKIRTYNFPQDRITDHRVRKNFGNIKEVMNGSLEKILNSLLDPSTST